MAADNDKKSAKHDKAGNPAGSPAPDDAGLDTGGQVMPGDEDFDVVVLDETDLADEDEDVSATMAALMSARVEADIVQANLAAIGTATAEDLEANLSAVGYAKADSVTAIGSAIALANAEGDVDINTSAVPLVIAKGDAAFHQAYASAFIAGGTVDIRQAGAPIIVGKQLSVEQGGGVVMLASEADVHHGFVGLLVSPNATLSDDTRVLLSTKAALIVAAAILGGFGIVAVVMVLGVRRVMQWRPQIKFPSLPRLADLEDRIRGPHHK